MEVNFFFLLPVSKSENCFPFFFPTYFFLSLSFALIFSLVLSHSLSLSLSLSHVCTLKLLTIALSSPSDLLHCRGFADAASKKSRFL